MPYHRVWLGRVLLVSLILSALESNHGIQASSVYRYAAKRDVIDQDLDSIIEEFRSRIGKGHPDEIAKESLKSMIAQYPGWEQDYPRANGRPYYQAVRGQKTKMPGWDRGEGLVEQEDEPPRRGHFGSRQQHHHRQETERPEPQFQEQAKQEPEVVQVPLHNPNHKEEHIEKESDPKTDVKIAPVPEDILEQDQPTHPTPAARQEYDDRLHPMQEVASMADIYFLAVVAGCSVAGLVGLVVAGVCWYRLQKNVKAASEVEYPAYGITGPTKETLGSPGDRKLAQSAQMYHYQHQKQQMIALEKANGEMKNDGSEDDSDEENEEGDYTVYECPGLAPTGEMEVKNPLFSEETPVTPTPDDRREMK